MFFGIIVYELGQNYNVCFGLVTLAVVVNLVEHWNCLPQMFNDSKRYISKYIKSVVAF